MKHIPSYMQHDFPRKKKIKYVFGVQVDPGIFFLRFLNLIIGENDTGENFVITNL